MPRAASRAGGGLAVDDHGVRRARGPDRGCGPGDGQGGDDLLEHGFLLEKGHEEP